MKYSFGLIFLICCLSLTEGHKAKNHNKKQMKEIKKELDALDVKIAKLVEDTNRILLCLNTTWDSPNWDTVCVEPEEDLASPSARKLDRTDVSVLTAANLDIFWAANMYMNNGDRCGSTVSIERGRRIDCPDLTFIVAIQ